MSSRVKSAAYGANLIEKLATDMTQRYGRGFSRQNLWQMRQFSLAYPPEQILQTASGESAQPEDQVLPEETIKDPFVLEFLDLKDEYSESDLEAGLIDRLETFLLELGSDFCFMGRHRRLRVGSEWYRVDLLFFHRHLRCLVIIDLKLGKFTHADGGQMHLYLNYAREHWARGENPPVGLILCSQKDESVARYALEGLPNKVMAAEYRTKLPQEKILVSEIARARKELSTRKGVASVERDA